MVDILSIGSGAVNAYKQALSTTSNNIANVNTPGYSKRSLQLGESFPVQTGVFSFGTGAQADAVKRAYDEFIESSLRDASGELAVNQPVIQYANRIVDLMAMESGSLSSAIDDFFNAAELLSAQPSSVIQRSEFLNSAEVVASRFNDISFQIDRVADDSEAEFRSAVAELNALAEQLVVVNRQLNRKASVDQQPAGLLDQRDAILRDMATLSKIGVTELNSGQVLVNFGGPGKGFEFVNTTDSKKVAIISTQEKSAVDLRLVLDPYGASRPLPNNPGGTLGGHLALNTEVLRSARVGVDHLATMFAENVNDVHQMGQDQYGDFGEKLFEVQTTFKPSFDTANGSLSASLTVVNSTAARAEALELMYRERVNAWDVINVVTRDRVATLPFDGGAFDGMEFSISGEPDNGDVIIFTPEYRPAQSLKVLISDPKKVSVAASMQSRPDIDNSSAIDATLTFSQPMRTEESVFNKGFEIKNTNEVAYRQDLVLDAGGRGPALQIPRDTSNVNIEFEIENDSEQHLHVFTNEGVHLAGTGGLSLAEANQMIASDNGFGEGAYSATYLNKMGSDAYLNSGIRFGVSSQTIEETILSIDPETGSLSETPQVIAPSVISKPVNATLNSEALSANLIDQGDLIFEYIVSDPTHADADDDGFVRYAFDLDQLSLEPGMRLSARSMAEYFTSQFEANGLADFSASAITRVIATDIDPERSLSINGEEISLDPAMGIGDVIAAINASSASTNVKAEWIGEDGIALVNSSGHGGENIVLGAPALIDEKSALGQVSGTYSGTYELSVTGTDSSTNRPSIESFEIRLSDMGVPSDVGRLGFNTEMIINGKAPADLAIFVVGSGNLDASVRVSPVMQEQEREYPARPFRVDFVSDSIYTITDIETDTVVTTRLYDNLSIRYQDVAMEFASNPKSGDTFFVEQNLNGVGNNENLLALIDLGKQPIIEGQTFSEAYRDLVAGAGSRSRLSELNKEAMQVVKDQAEAAREASVGVNLDEEAADLIRFQQAYQAAAQVIQISQRMFDTLIQAG